ncbi:hypothetical protein CBS101457_003142 [Exobasidium rhododendri]|nr:hypothetical protein CBS101457_003142 [Exobasidium rhododendri]
MLASASNTGGRSGEIPKLKPVRAKVERLSASDAASALPIRVAQSSADIEGHCTQVLTQHYADRILVIVTQVGKVGALTQMTTQKRPAFPSLQEDDDDDFPEDMDAYREQKRKRKEEADSNRNGNDDYVVSLQSLFGSVPIGQETLYDFYKQQIAALILKQVQEQDGSAAAIESGLGSKPIIVGLSLVLPSSNSMEDDEEGDFAALADTERTRFQAVLELVSQARTW